MLTINPINNVNFNAQLKFNKVSKRVVPIAQDVANEFAIATEKYPNHNLTFDNKNLKVLITKNKDDKVFKVAEYSYTPMDPDDNFTIYADDSIEAFLSNYSLKQLTKVFKTMFFKAMHEEKLNELAWQYAEQVERSESYDRPPKFNIVANWDKLSRMAEYLEEFGFKSL